MRLSFRSLQQIISMKNKLVLSLLFTIVISVGCQKDPSIAKFITDKGTYYYSEPIIITNLSSDANDYLWNFGDDSTSTAYVPLHTYKKPGNYIIELKTNKNESSYEQKIKILDGTSSFQVKNISQQRYRWINYERVIEGQKFLFNWTSYVDPGKLSDTSLTYIENLIINPYNDNRELIKSQPVIIQPHQHTIIEVND